jgi:hypothetical protein
MYEVIIEKVFDRYDNTYWWGIKTFLVDGFNKTIITHAMMSNIKAPFEKAFKYKQIHNGNVRILYIDYLGEVPELVETDADMLNIVLRDG